MFMSLPTRLLTSINYLHRIIKSYYMKISSNPIKKSPIHLEKSINLEAKEAAAGIKIDDIIEYMAKAPAYITLKGHKDNFRSAHPCRLINPCKSEIGKINKSILENINKNLVKLLQANQWRNSESVITWFYSIENKSQCKFIQLDIAEFRPSTSEEVLHNAILFAQQYIDIPEKDFRIIKHCRKSLLYNDNEPWKKKIQKAASMSPWAVLMVPKSASLSASIYYLYYQINLINHLLVCIEMMIWYF